MLLLVAAEAVALAGSVGSYLEQLAGSRRMPGTLAMMRQEGQDNLPHDAGALRRCIRSYVLHLRFCYLELE